MWNPVPSTWIQAIDAGFFTTWPGLTSAAVKNHLQPTIETSKGHMRATRANIRSTKSTSSTSKHNCGENKRTNEFYTKIIEPTGKVFSDQTGKFPVTSSKGNKYVMVVYDHDSNAILSEPLKSKSSSQPGKFFLIKQENFLLRQARVINMSWSSTTMIQMQF